MLLSGAPPFNGDSSDKIHYLIQNNEPDFSMKMFPKAQPRTVDFLKQLLVKDPAKRISIENAFQHPFLQQTTSEYSMSRTVASFEVVSWSLILIRINLFIFYTPPCALSHTHPQTCARTRIPTYVCTFLSLYSCLFSIFISITITPMLPPHLLYRSNILKLPHIQMNSLGRFMKLSRFKKLMLEAVAFSLTPAQISVLRTDFHAIDTDRSGAISLIELQEYVTKVTIFFGIYALYLFYKLEVSSCEYMLL